MTATAVISNINHNNIDNMEAYSVGNRDNREWGWFEVVDTGIEANEEYCEKNIGILPHQALSLQRHHGRREIWTVTKGTLTVILDGEHKTLEAGETINIPLKSAHCMINLNNEEIVVHERQIGVCRESDNDRLCDFNGRDTIPVIDTDFNALKSILLYKKITASLVQKAAIWNKTIATNSNISDANSG